ncbi:ACP S-malonyltransferase [Romeria aff. gracilis LEGE 07310]|uniref:Malonyl CoA-acyl carrier protein transacylase n=1 Tax=Vasconcelosia minhoensis LEGE 07310 TaxID=915328 RepID=A0A8J7DBD1_9CYAN|nr:ACP S-malonyltransferase [Romeria gracilis]MBE9076238.1 ACP S-malonyltransferase [Romeria aff. gracilis LEGE 07310]
MAKTAWVFPGQGSQSIGMGTDLADIGTARFSQAEDILGWSVLEICGSEDDKVSNTLYTQPCLYVIESILADALKAKGERPAVVAGHSLGEYSALYTAEVFSFAAGLRLVKRRAELMAQAAEGSMAALMGFKREALEAALANTADVVLANDNNAGQVVISGTAEAVEAAIQQVKARRATRLNVSGAFHSPLMAGAAQEFADILNAVEFKDAIAPVLSNVDPTPSTDAAELKQRLTQQMTGSVRWREISLSLPKQGIDTVIEVGPGAVLTGLIKRTVKDLELKQIESLAQLEAAYS